MASVLRALQAPAAMALKRSAAVAGVSTRALCLARAHPTNALRMTGPSSGLARLVGARVAGGERAFIATPARFSDGDGKMESGIAKHWNDKGFGFIKPDDGGEDIFCHFSAITDGKCLVAGSKVEYIKSYDERRGKYRAEELTGGAPEDNNGYRGGGGGGGGYGGDRGGGGGYQGGGGGGYQGGGGGGGYQQGGGGGGRY
eukprot:CAMPEP_0180357926 /NCGR_PEP_ID=MMETSP0989-20121125/10227_1 /TAXON_ID=697907 /ORGANISM="non described non described, Strain CCMP2293" /LENGTH=199 /DNA_ID=CAMNT_0022348277 /DNA_START=45 /DNA_END=644 /DNA_ORIENTATION=+